MKYLIIILVLFSTKESIFAQSKNSTPEAVIASFKQKFPNATKIKWHKENATEYEVDFKIGKEKNSANFNADGTFLESEGIFSFTALPQIVQDAFKLKYPTAKIVTVEQISLASGETNFEIEFKKKGFKKQEAYYNADGLEVMK